MLRKVLRYQRGNQKPEIQGQTTQLPKEKKDKTLSTKHCTENYRSSNVSPTKNWG
jgi:hypothetical protein